MIILCGNFHFGEGWHKKILFATQIPSSQKGLPFHPSKVLVTLNFSILFPYFTFFPVYLNCPTFYICCLFILLLSVSSTKLLEGFLSFLFTAKSQEQRRMAHRWLVSICYTNEQPFFASKWMCPMEGHCVHLSCVTHAPRLPMELGGPRVHT